MQFCCQSLRDAVTTPEFVRALETFENPYIGKSRFHGRESPGIFNGPLKILEFLNFLIFSEDPVIMFEKMLTLLISAASLLKLRQVNMSLAATLIGVSTICCYFQLPVENSDNCCFVCSACVYDCIVTFCADVASCVSVNVRATNA